MSVAEVTLNGAADYGLFGVAVSVQTPVGPFSIAMGYQFVPAVGAVFQVAIALAALTIALGSMFVAFSFVPGRLRRVGALLGILAFIPLLVAPLYVMTTLPAASGVGALNGLPGVIPTQNTTAPGFWGSGSFVFEGVSLNFAWRAGWAWYVAFASGALFAAAGIIAARAAWRPSGVAAAPSVTPVPSWNWQPYLPPLPPPPPPED